MSKDQCSASTSSVSKSMPLHSGSQSSQRMRSDQVKHSEALLQCRHSEGKRDGVWSACPSPNTHMEIKPLGMMNSWLKCFKQAQLDTG